MDILPHKPSPARASARARADGAAPARERPGRRVRHSGPRSLPGAAEARLHPCVSFRRERAGRCARDLRARSVRQCRRHPGPAPGGRSAVDPRSSARARVKRRLRPLSRVRFSGVPAQGLRPTSTGAPRRRRRWCGLPYRPGAGKERQVRYFRGVRRTSRGGRSVQTNGQPAPPGRCPDSGFERDSKGKRSGKSTFQVPTRAATSCICRPGSHQGDGHTSALPREAPSRASCPPSRPPL